MYQHMNDSGGVTSPIKAILHVFKSYSNTIKPSAMKYHHQKLACLDTTKSDPSINAKDKRVIKLVK